MSKKNRQFDSNNNSAPSTVAETESRAIRHDLVQTVIVNVIFIAALVGLYYWDKSAGEPLSNLVGRFL